MKHLPITNKYFERILDEFSKMIETKGYRQGGGFAIQSYVREFLFFIENKSLFTMHQVKASHLIEHYEYLRERPNQRKEGGLSESMIKHHLYALRIFFDYLVDAGEIESSPARLPKFQFGSYAERKNCTTEEIKLLYSVCENLKEKALLGIAYGCGLRRTEIENLNTSDLIFNRGQLIVRSGKGNKPRSVPMADNVIKDLREYLIHERRKYITPENVEYNPAFFINTMGRRMGGDYLNELVRSIVKRTNNINLISKNITLHCLRHSIATHLMDNGANIEFVQKFLGHSSIDATHIYSKRRKQQLKLIAQIR